MNNSNLTFGEFIRQMRINKGDSLRKVAQIMEYSPTYWSDIENGRRNPPNIEKLQQICDYFALDTTNKDRLFDLAGDFEQIPPPDLTDYLQDPSVRRALRVAKNHNITADAWVKFEQSILEGKSK